MLRACLIRLLAATCLILAAAVPAHAIPPIQVNDGPGVVEPEGTAASCLLEPAPLSLIAYAWGAPTEYTRLAWRIPRSVCASCPSPYVLSLNEILLRLRWFATPCTVTVVVSIVGVKGSADCPEPDTTVVLCGPEPYTLVRTLTDNYETYSTDFDEGCCIFQDAFVYLQFAGFNTCVGPNGLSTGISAATGVATPCQQYVTLSDYYPTFTDWSTVGTGLRPLWLQIQADCCAATPAHRKSWGGVKTIYR